MLINAYRKLEIQTQRHIKRMRAENVEKLSDNVDWEMVTAMQLAPKHELDCERPEKASWLQARPPADLSPRPRARRPRRLPKHLPRPRPRHLMFR